MKKKPNPQQKFCHQERPWETASIESGLKGTMMKLPSQTVSSELWWLKWTKGLWQISSAVFGGHSPMTVGITSPWRQLWSIKGVTWVIYYLILKQLKCPGRNWHSAWRPWLIFDNIQELGKRHKHCRSSPQWANCIALQEKSMVLEPVGEPPD